MILSRQSSILPDFGCQFHLSAARTICLGFAQVNHPEFCLEVLTPLSRSWSILCRFVLRPLPCSHPIMLSVQSLILDSDPDLSPHGESARPHASVRNSISLGMSFHVLALQLLWFAHEARPMSSLPTISPSASLSRSNTNILPCTNSRRRYTILLTGLSSRQFLSVGSGLADDRYPPSRLVHSIWHLCFPSAWA